MSHKDVLAAGTTSKNPIGSPDSDAEQLASLKKLLFSEERAELEALRSKLEESGTTPDELSSLLPKAVWKAASRDEQLADALGPLFAKAIKSAIKNDAESIADAISPIMGPAIRATIQESIRGMMQSLNKTLEHSVSAKGLKWRWEAMTTGKSFAEVVLLHTLRYRVEQAVLVDPNTGLMIKHASIPEMEENVDLTSSMLTALEDFGRDSLRASEDGSLSTFIIGEKTVWAESGPHADLVLVIEGEAPSSLRTRMQETLEQIHVRFGDELATYEGDSAPFAAAQPLLEDCLMSAYEEDEKKAAKEKANATKEKKELTGWQKGLITAAIGGVLIGGYLINKHFADRRHVKQIRRQLAAPPTVELELENGRLTATGEARHAWIEEANNLSTRLPGVVEVELDGVTNLDEAWQRYLVALRDTPGIVVTDSSANRGQYALTGLRDPLAIDPVELLEPHKLSPETVATRWSPFQSLEPEIVAKRIVAALPPSNTIETEWADGTIRLTGTASAEWIANAIQQTAPLSTDTVRLDFDGVKADAEPSPTPSPAAPPRIDLRAIIQQSRLEQRYLLFQSGTDELVAGSNAKLRVMAKEMKTIIAAAEQTDQDVTITLVGIGETSEVNADNSNSLGKERAQSVWRTLQRAGVPAGNVLIQGIPNANSIRMPAGFSREMAADSCLIRLTVTSTQEKP